MLRFVTLCCDMFRFVTLCCVMLCSVTLLNVMLPHVLMLRHFVPPYVKLCFVTLCYGCVVLCYVIYNITSSVDGDY